MPERRPSSRLIRFGLFETDLGAGELRKNGSKVKLQDRPFEILIILLERPGLLITREEFRQRLWPADTFVDFDHSLNASINKLRQALDDSADNPRFVATVGRRGYRFIAPVVPPSAPEPAPASPPVQAATDSLPGARTKQLGLLHRRSLRILVGVLAIASLLGGLWIRSRWPGRGRIRAREARGNGDASATPVKLRRSFAVFGLRNLAGKADEYWLSTALAEMLSTELAAGEQMRVVSGEGVARAKLDLGLSDADSYSPETLARLRKNLGSDYVIAGTYLALGDKTGGEVRMDLRLQDATNGETIAVVSESGNEAHLPDLISRAGLRLRQRLGLSETTTAEDLSILASLPSNPEAARLYAEGLANLRVFDALAARDFLQEAVALEPQYPLLHSALASAWTALGYDNKAREEAQRAFGLSVKLPREQRLLVEGSYCETIRDWAKAVEIYRTLFLLFPDNLDYGLHLVRAQVSGSSGRGAQATLEILRKLPPPLSEDPRIDLVEVDVAASLSDYKRELAAAERAASKGAAQGSRLLQAQARLNQGLALDYLGEPAAAAASLAEAKETFATVGDRANTAAVLLYLADTASERGDYSQALQFYRDALTINREIGHESGMGTDLNNMAVLFENQRDFLTAQKTYEQALAIYRKIGDKRRENVALGNLAEVLFYRGNLGAAASRYQQSLDAFHAMGDSSNEAAQLKGTALVLEARGDLAGAKSKFEQALSIWHANGYLHPYTEAMLDLGEVQLAQGDLPGARKTQEEALAIRQKLGEKESIAESQLALATLSLEEGRAGEAEQDARKAVAEFQAESVPDLIAAANTVLARALLQQGRTAEAQEAAKSAIWLSAKSQELMIRLSVAITAARVRMASSGGSSSRKQSTGLIIRDLEVLSAQAKKSGLLGFEFEAKLALGETELGAARRAQGRAQLASLEKEAQTRGFLLIARKAATAQE